MVLFHRSKKSGRPATADGEPNLSPNSKSQHRLSKPRVNAFANSGAYTSKYTLNTLPDGNESVIESPSGDRRTRQAARQTLRSQLCGPEDQEDEYDGYNEDSLGDLVGSARDRLSRSGSQATHYLSAKGSVTQLNNGSQTSVAPENRTIHLETAVAILQELRKTASPEDLVALRKSHTQIGRYSSDIEIDKALLPTTSSNGTSPTRDGPIPYSSAAVIRRKSLATPGVATRQPSIKDEKQSEYQPAGDHLWRGPVSRAARFTRLSTVESVDEELMAATRAGTPGAIEYTQLGTHKHGSLMVMNGPASPSPSIISKTMSPKKSLADLHRDEYFTASEGEDPQSAIDDVDDFGSPLSPPKDCLNSLDLLPSQRDRAGRAQHRFIGTNVNPATRGGSPLKHQMRGQSEEPELLNVSQSSSNYMNPRAASSYDNVMAQSLRRDSADDEMEPYKVSPMGSHRSAVSLASEYIADLPPSAYASALDLSHQTVPGLEAEPLSLESMQPDEGYYDASPEYETPDNELFNEFDGHPPFKREITPETALRSHPPQPQDAPLKSTLKPKRSARQTKSDSGYSSSYSGYDSLRSSTRSEKHPPLTPITAPAIATPPLADVQNYSPEGAASTYTIRTMLAMTCPEDALRSLQPSALSERLPKPPEVERSKSWRKSMRKSLPRLLSSESAIQSVASLDSKPSNDSKVTLKQKDKPRKLQKKRPLSQQSFAVGFPKHLENGNVPRVPSDVSSRFSFRIARAPEREHLEQTVESAFGRNSGLGAISPGAGTFGNTFAEAENGSNILGDAPPPIPPHRFGASQRRSRVIDEDEEIVTGVAGFGSVAQSIGSSPYDIATASFSRRPVTAAPTHPYQMSSFTPQYGPRQGWDDETAVRMAQMRSRERAAAAAAQDYNMAERPSMPVRPRSYHENSGFIAPNRVPSNSSDIGSRRPRSVYGDSPAPASVPAPAPALDLPVIPPRKRAQTTRSQSVPRQPSFEMYTSQPGPLLRSTTDMPLPNTGRVAQLAATFHQPESAPPPLPPVSAALDWSHQADVWRQRKLAAQTTVTTESAVPFSKMTTTTTTTVVSSAPASHPQPLPWLSSSRPATAHPLPSDALVPVGSTDAARRKSAEPERMPEVPMFTDEGIFGRYGGGFHYGDVGRKYMGAAGKREVSLATGGLREWGVDLGDVPSAVVGGFGGGFR